MVHVSAASREKQSIEIIGAGIAGSWQALAFARAGHAVTLHERSAAGDLSGGTSHWAGGMLAPYCEAEASEALITRLGVRALGLWREAVPEATFNGSLVVAHPRDRNDFERFARLTTNHQRLGAREIDTTEPALGGLFREALFFADEGHVEPRTVLPLLHRQIVQAGGRIVFGSEGPANDNAVIVDCRGLAARAAQPGLRGVKGEMIIVETDEIALQRPVRLIHPRWPLYVIPRVDNQFMIGASTIEREDTGVSVRSALELLGAAYAVHPAFGEARIVEIGSGLRPAFSDNLPRIAIDRNRIAVNGLYRHGFLLAPALAELTHGYVARGEIDADVMRVTRALEVMRCA